MFASTEVWLLQSVAGIQPHPAARGMNRVLIKPAPPTQLAHAAASFDTPRGTIRVAWARRGGRIALGASASGRWRGVLELNVSLPPNVRATVHVPTRQGGVVRESGRVVRGGRLVSGANGRGSSVAHDVGSGVYAFTSHAPSEESSGYG